MRLLCVFFLLDNLATPTLALPSRTRDTPGSHRFIVVRPNLRLDLLGGKIPWQRFVTLKSTHMANPKSGKISKPPKKKGHELQKAEDIYHGLLRARRDIVVTAKQAVVIFKMFRDIDIGVASVEKLEHRAFLQAALMSAIEASAAIGWVVALFKSALKPNPSLAMIIGKLAAEGLRQYYNSVDISKVKLDELKLYSAVINEIVRTHHPYFDVIYNDLDY